MPPDAAAPRPNAGRRAGPVAHVLACEQETRGPLQRLLEQLRVTMKMCHSLEDALRETGRDHFDAAIVSVGRECVAAAGLLQLLRRVMPRTPIVLVLDDPSPAARLATLVVRPFYVAVPPVSPEEMAAVMRDVVAAGRKQA